MRAISCSSDAKRRAFFANLPRLKAYQREANADDIAPAQWYVFEHQVGALLPFSLRPLLITFSPMSRTVCSEDSISSTTNPR